MSDLVERAAEAAWQAESLRAARRPRLAPWAEANPEIQEAWRDTVRAIIPIVRADALEEAADCAQTMIEDGIRNGTRIATAIRSLAKG